MMTARMPWYDFDFLSNDHHSFWTALRFYLQGASAFSSSVLPEQLTRHSKDLDSALVDPQLLFSQTCGYDIAAGLPGPLEVIATPIYDFEGCRDGYYSSWVVVHENSLIQFESDLNDTVMVANDDRSWSGFHAIRTLEIRPRNIIFSGGHCASLEMLRSGIGDFALIDAVVWGQLKRQQAHRLQGFKILEQTSLVPAPPLVTAASRTPEQVATLREGLNRMIEISKSNSGLAEALNRLGIVGFVEIHEGNYQFMAKPKMPRRQFEVSTHTSRALSPYPS